MAYFSNGSEGMLLTNQCAKCKLGEKACPIAYVQMAYNYDACNNPIARGILDGLVDNEKGCDMFVHFPEVMKVQP